MTLIVGTGCDSLGACWLPRGVQLGWLSVGRWVSKKGPCSEEGVGEGVDGRLDLLGPGDDRLHQLPGRQLPPPEQLHSFGRRQVVKISPGRHFTDPTSEAASVMRWTQGRRSRRLRA